MGFIAPVSELYYKDPSNNEWVIVDHNVSGITVDEKNHQIEIPLDISLINELRYKELKLKTLIISVSSFSQIEDADPIGYQIVRIRKWNNKGSKILSAGGRRYVTIRKIPYEENNVAEE